nr:hypothetical protein [uncultured Methanolobus sp.]
MIIKTLYIDDVLRERNRYKYNFEENDFAKENFELTVIDTPKSTNEYDSIKKLSPQLILVDHDLSVPDEAGNVIGITGLTLITELKQYYYNIPIILFTKQSVFNEDSLKSFSSLLSIVDKVIYKSELFKPERNLEELHDFACSYQKLANIEGKITWSGILKLLDAPNDDIGSIKQSAPPELLKNNLSVTGIAKWVTEVLLPYPGILYDSLYMAAFLGISESAFLDSSLQEYFSKAKYSGIFEKSGNYWWKSRIIDIISENMNDDELDLPIREGFHQFWKRINEIDLDKSKCIDSNNSPAEWVCYVLEKPMMLNLSLPYYPDSRPEVMDEARVSFKAIRTTNDVNPEMIDSLVLDKYYEIRGSRGEEQ